MDFSGGVWRLAFALALVYVLVQISSAYYYTDKSIYLSDNITTENFLFGQMVFGNLRGVPTHACTQNQFISSLTNESISCSSVIQNVLNVNRSTYWDGYDSPADIPYSGAIIGSALSPDINSSWTNTSNDLRYQSRDSWITHDDYPSVCGVSAGVNGIGDSLTCLVFLNKTYADTLYATISQADAANNNITLLFNNASNQDIRIISLEGAVSNNVSALFTNASVQETSIRNLWTNATNQDGVLTLLWSNASGQSTHLTNLWTNASVQETHISDLWIQRLNETYANTLYIKFVAETRNITTAANMSIGGYYWGQPLRGMLGSGLIDVGQGTGGYTNDINVSCTALNCAYSNFTMRINGHNANDPAKYCFVPSGTVAVPDNTFSTYYVDVNCALQQTTYDTWFTTTMKAGSAWDAFYVVAQNGVVEVLDSISLERRRDMKGREINYYLNQGKVIRGVNFQTWVWPGFNITEGRYIFGMDDVSLYRHNISTTAQTVELVGHATGSTWTSSDQYGLNVTYCDTGSAIAICTGNNFRRHFIFAVGFDGSISPASEIMQLYPLESVSYSSAANCLDTTAYPLTYTLPDYYTGAAVPLYAYCSQRTATSWNSARLIDLRTVKTGSSTGGTDISGLVPYSGATGNVNLATWNITAAQFIKDGVSVVLPVENNLTAFIAYWRQNTLNRSGTLTNGKFCTYNSATGNVDCNTDETGDISGVTAGMGLSGGGTSGTVTLNIDPAVVVNDTYWRLNTLNRSGTLTDGKFCTYASATGVVSCNTDEIGDISAVTAGNGLTGGGTTGAVTLAVGGVTPQNFSGTLTNTKFCTYDSATNKIVCDSTGGSGTADEARPVILEVNGRITTNASVGSGNLNVTGNIQLANNISSRNAIDLIPSGDNDDYLQVSTVGDVPRVSAVGTTAIDFFTAPVAYMRYITGSKGSQIINLNSDDGQTSSISRYNGTETAGAGLYLSDSNGPVKVLPNGVSADYIAFTSNAAQQTQQVIGGGMLNLSTDGGVINLVPSGDPDDYLQFSTVSNVPEIKAIGGGVMKLTSDVGKGYSKFSSSGTLTYQYIYDDAGLIPIGFEAYNATAAAGLASNGLMFSNTGSLLMMPNGDIDDYIYFDTVANIARLSPLDNNTYTLGYPGKLWSTIYVKSTVTGDIWMDGINNTLVRKVERQDGVFTQFIPKSLIKNCKNTDRGDGSVEVESQCWERIGDTYWNSTVKTLETYDGDFIDSQGNSLRDTVENQKKLQQILVDKLGLKQSDLDGVGIKKEKSKKDKIDAPIVVKDKYYEVQTTTTTTSTSTTTTSTTSSTVTTLFGSTTTTLKPTTTTTLGGSPAEGTRAT